MKIGILGTGMVGSTIGGALLRGGHAVMMGSRTAANEKAVAWARAAGAATAHGTFADAARFGEMVFNLVDARVLSKTEEDSRADFIGGYDFDTAFRQPFLPSRKPASAPSPETHQA